ncbi:hypothetical protein CHU92_03620 [Flavobacterium cyanobacteriorum]|uniref:Uncharacterized protein n=1 Tax=Flavobacterium cyanobacteriorum TaxID=2022802 RepID=A0A255ZP43_9FLAO|nr:hypothetical protein [Flavobacterium cyanobacteriorum]OYQ43162.1 hypothetical protein CHU92_03620 [Flavobacterium cyanobacteriorum]
MEPNKLEKEFREKLAKRTIEPGKMAWDRLDAMLSVAENKKKPRKKTWLYIAAGFAGFVLLGALFFKTNYKQEEDFEVNSGGTIVTAPANPVLPHHNKVQQTEEENNKMPAAVNVNDTVPIGVAVNKGKPSAKTNSYINTADPVHHNAGNESGSSIVNNPATENTVAVAVAPEKPADNDIAQNTPAPKKKAIKVDANALLSSVEGELDESFRTKALNTITKNYNTIKTSLANRNHQ